MNSIFDINLLPIARYGGRDFPELIGLHFTEPPRRSARGRDQDYLVFYLVIDGTALMPVEQRDKILVDLSRLYFRTPGSVTAALRSTVEELNRLLYERNTQPGDNRQYKGHFNQIILRENRLTVALSGLMQIHKITSDGVMRLDSPELAGNGLGVEKSAAVYFTQTNIQPNDVLMLSAKQAPDWTDDVLLGVHGQGPETLRRRLFYQSKSDINAVAVQIKPGKGKFLLVRSGASQPAVIEEVKTSAPAIPLQVASPAAVETVMDKPVITQSAVANKLRPGEEDIVADQTEVVTSIEQIEMENEPAGVSVSEKPKATKAFSPGFGRLGQWMAQAVLKAGASIRVFAGRMLPDESFLNIPKGLMATIAILVPIAVVVAASTIYFRLGRSAQYDLFSSQAQLMLQRAEQRTDPSEKREDLSAALGLFQKAEIYASDSTLIAEVKAWQSEVRQGLDELELVRRVSYQPAIIGGLELTHKITEIKAVGDELYLLDENSSSVLRAYLTDKGYEIDYTFQCGPGTYGGIQIGSLVEIIVWPVGYIPQANLLAIDSGGNALYCQPNQVPEAESLVPGEGDDWGKILDATLDQGDIYLLDLPSKGVWIYWRANFNEQPTLFFDEQIPPLENVVDMLVDRDDLYLLQENGRLVLCTRETLVVSPTRCQFQDFIDRRKGRENTPLTPASPFTQITYTAPPDPSLYFLEPANQAIYHFSLRNLALQKQYLPDQPLPASPATAFAVNQEKRLLYLAVGNQVFYSAIP